MQNTRKTKRKLTDISFEKEGCHVALVSKDQGGGANGHNYALVMKASNFSQEFIEKASQVQVQLEITEYLTRFYGIWQHDAEVLARTLGFTTAAQDKAVTEIKEQQLEDKEPPEYSWDMQPGDSDYERYIESKVASINIMKSLYEADNCIDALSKLSEDEYLQLLQDQSMLEKAFKQIEKANKESKDVAKAAAKVEPQIVDEVNKSEVTTSVVKRNKKEPIKMTEKTVVVEKEIEMVEKSMLESIQKQLSDNQVELQKALDLVKQFETEKKAEIQKSRTAELQAVIKDEVTTANVFKALKEDVTADEFAAVVKAFADVQALVEQSDLFKEKGASVESEDNQVIESAVAKALKAKLNIK